MNGIVVAYGFEFSNFIPFLKSDNICQSIITNNPIYYSLIIRDTYIDDIVYCIEYAKENRQQEIKIIQQKYENLLRFVEKYNCHLCKIVYPPRWQIVYKNAIYNRDSYIIKQRPMSPIRFSLVNPDNIYTDETEPTNTSFSLLREKETDIYQPKIHD